MLVGIGHAVRARSSLARSSSDGVHGCVGMPGAERVDAGGASEGRQFEVGAVGEGGGIWATVKLLKYKVHLECFFDPR